MIFNKSTEYSIKILSYMSNLNSTEYKSAGEISFALNLPKEYTAKILQLLSNQNIVESRKGKGGGFRLLMDSSEISIGDVINTFESKSFFCKCIIGLTEDCNNNKCSFHKEWLSLKNKIYQSKISEISNNKLFFHLNWT